MKKCIFMSILGLCFLSGCGNSKQAELEPLESTVSMKESDTVIEDDSNRYSKLQLKQEESDVLVLLDSFNQRFYSFNYKNTKKNDYNTGIEAFFDKNSEKYEFSVGTAYKDFKKDKTICTYQDTEILSFVILNKDETKSQVVALANASIENSNLKKGDYSILTTYILQKEENEWKLLSRIPSTIYKKGSTKFTKEAESDQLTVTGTVVGEYTLPQETQKEKIEEAKGERSSSGDGYMEEQITGEPASESTTEFTPEEKTYDSLEDAITDELIEQGTKNHD